MIRVGVTVKVVIVCTFMYSVYSKRRRQEIWKYIPPRSKQRNNNMNQRNSCSFTLPSLLVCISS